MPHRLYLEQFGNVHALPVLHYKMEFAHLVRQAVELVQPDCIAIELPPTLEALFLRGIRRLPEISALTYDVSTATLLRGKVAEGGSQSVYLLIEPADPLVAPPDAPDPVEVVTYISPEIDSGDRSSKKALLKAAWVS